MSQSTADELLNSLGFAAVKTESITNNIPAKSETVVSTSRRRHVTIAVISSLFLATGFKMIGDYTCDRTIDAWVARETAKFAAATPESIKFFESMAYEDDTIQDSQTAAGPAPVSVGE